jgi:pimeloyl-ACP methyl ester carboxylesterase
LRCDGATSGQGAESENAAVIRPVLNSLLYFPSRAFMDTPGRAGLDYRDLALDTDDGERLHGWWLGAQAEERLGQLLLCHGNAGNVGDRVLHGALLTAVGFDVLLFDYRGYGRSSGRPTEEGTYRDARAAREALLREAGAEGSQIFYLGESLGGAVALDLAFEFPPRGLVLQSTFTGVRDMARLYYPFIPRGLVPDAYPTLRRIGEFRTPLLLLHGERDEIVPVSHGRALLEAAPGPKRMHVFPGVGHNDLVPLAGRAYAETIAAWARSLAEPVRS